METMILIQLARIVLPSKIPNHFEIIKKENDEQDIEAISMTILLDERMDLIPYSVPFTHNKSAVPDYWGTADCECIMCNNTYLELLFYN
jgi:hypothetical protein